MHNSNKTQKVSSCFHNAKKKKLLFCPNRQFEGISWKSKFELSGDDCVHSATDAWLSVRIKWVMTLNET